MKVEIRNDSVILDGYVNVPGKNSRLLPSPKGQFVEQIMPQVFQRALERTDNVDVLFNHRNDKKLGSTQDGNLKLFEDAIGLRAIATVTDEEVINLAKNSQLRGWSFGFICRSDKWTESEGIQRRYVEDLDLLEVSVLSVTPAYYATSIESRGEETVIHEQRFIETELEVVDTTEKNIQEEVRKENSEPISYALFEREIEIIKIKGGMYS